jgi:hypothetical protein
MAMKHRLKSTKFSTYSKLATPRDNTTTKRNHVPHALAWQPPGRPINMTLAECDPQYFLTVHMLIIAPMARVPCSTSSAIYCDAHFPSPCSTNPA